MSMVGNQLLVLMLQFIFDGGPSNVFYDKRVHQSFLRLQKRWKAYNHNFLTKRKCM